MRARFIGATVLRLAAHQTDCGRRCAYSLTPIHPQLVLRVSPAPSATATRCSASRPNHGGGEGNLRPKQPPKVRPGRFISLNVIDGLALAVECCLIGSEVGVEHCTIRHALPASRAEDDESIDVVVDDLAPGELAVGCLISHAPLRADQVVVNPTGRQDLVGQSPNRLCKRVRNFVQTTSENDT